MIRIIRAGADQLPMLVPLFDQYRVFYKQPSDLIAAESFLRARMEGRESVVFMALLGEVATGFTQLYPAFSSVSLQPLFILNDLYVAKNFRGQGIGEKLLRSAQDFCRENGHKGLALETAVDNPAQKLYERLGWQKDSHCFHYFWNAG